MRRTATVLVVALAFGLAGAQPGGASDPVAEATRSVQELQARVAGAAAGMAEATRRLDASRRALAQVRRQRADAEREAGEAAVRADAARERLSRVAAAAYRSPVPDSFVLAVSGPEAFRAVTAAHGDLERASASTSDLMRTAAQERERARTAAARAEALERDAAAQADAVAASLAQLRARAQDTGRELRSAWSRLSVARLAAGASCAGTATAAANGFLPASSLCPLAGAPGHRLRGDAAADFARLTAASVAERGTALCVTDSYRSYAEQVDVFARKPQLAAVPGTSRHGLGVALDLGCGVESFGTEAHRWMQANGPRFGWVHPAWAGPDGSMPEPWHWEHAG